MADEKHDEIQSFNRELLNLDFDEISVEALEQRLEFSGILRPDLFYNHGEPGHEYMPDPNCTSHDCGAFGCGQYGCATDQQCPTPPPPPPPCPSLVFAD